MDIRYVKRISDGRIFISSEEDGLTQSNAEKVALAQGGTLADYEIGVDTVENCDQMIVDARTVHEVALIEIGRLERTVTQRRQRDAHASKAGKDWIVGVESAIVIERAKLNG